MTQITNWDNFVRLHTKGHALQLENWGKHKAAFGWTYDLVTLTDESKAISAGTLLLFRPLPLRLGTMAYLPMGPLPESNNPKLWHAIHVCARRHRAAFLKWEPGIFLNRIEPDYLALGFQPSPQTIQPPRTVLIDISSDKDSIMKRMNQGTRRKIRQSYKKGVVFRQGTRDDLPRFNALMQATGQRNEFGVHSADYYTLAYDYFIPDDAALFLAQHEDDLLAGIMIFAVGETAWYLYGASSNVKRNLMASYGIQWEAIKWAKERGCTTYDMWGVPDEDADILEAQFQERNDGLWGVYGFKRGWGGDVVRSAGAWDYIYNPLVYQAYKLALRLR